MKRRTAVLVFVLCVLVGTVSTALGHGQAISDGKTDAVDYSNVDSDLDGKGTTSTPLDLKSVKFAETERRFIFTLRMYGKVSPDELCDNGCSPSTWENEGIIDISFYKGTDADPKDIYFVPVIRGDSNSYATALYRVGSDGRAERVDDGVEGAVLDEGAGFVLKVKRSKLNGYKKGARMRWGALTDYLTSADGDKCVPNQDQPNYGACRDLAPNGASASHRLRS